jgi:peptidoglycan biosynthesis protein MviN/MurJ (putative lipid II flippase)
VNAMSEAASQTGSGVGRPDFDMRGAILLIVLNPVLSLLLVQQYGPPGAALGTTLALISSACYVLWSFHRHWVGSSVGALLRDIHLRPWLGALLAAAAVWGLERTVPEIETALGSRLLTPLKLLLDLAVFTGVYAAALTFSGHLTAVDWRNLKGLLAFGAGAVRRRGTAVSGRMSVPSSQDV